MRQGAFLMKNLNVYCRNFILAFGILFLSACSENSPSLSLLSDQNIFQQSPSTLNNKLDILWVIDNSGSMAPYQQNLADNFSAFITDFDTKGYDYRMAVTTSDTWMVPFFKNPTRPELARFKDGSGANHSGVFVIESGATGYNPINVFKINAKVGTSGNGDERAFSSMMVALKSDYNTDFRRDDAYLAVIIVSDEDDFSHDKSFYLNNNYNHADLHTVEKYVTELDSYTSSTAIYKKYSVSAIAVLDSACQQTNAQYSLIGQRYMQMVNLTNGIQGSICDANFSNSLQSIQQRIAELSTQFYLNRVPVPSTLRVYVNSNLIDEDGTNGWSYNSVSNSIVFHGSAIPSQGATIVVDFDPVTVK